MTPSLAGHTESANTALSGRDALAAYALERIPKLLTLQDRNPHSPTYGSFDRNFWHLRIKDFPSGMAQEYVWPLALAWSLDLPDNPYRHATTVREWIAAGIRYAAKSAHPDGSCDDYFPFERATGAAAFSLLGCLESAAIIDLDDPEVDAFFARRADWLGRHKETGRLSNHEALVALCLLKTGQRLGSDRWQAAAEDRIARLLSWQHEEGWFAEYEGCDPGYLTLTIGILTEIAAITGRSDLRERAQQAAGVAIDFMHPDGSFGGEYTSRNTYNFFPHGLEALGPDMPAALAANDRFLQSLAAGRAPCYDDDHIFGHHLWSYMLTWRDFAADRPTTPPAPQGRTHYPAAGLLIERRGPFALYVGLGKGGVFKLFRDDRLIASDTQVSLLVQDKRKQRTAVAHLIGPQHHHTLAEDRITVQGPFGWAKQTQMTPFRQMVLRCIVLTAGRFFPNLVRSLLQKMLIVGAKSAPYRYERTFDLGNDAIEVTDRVTADNGWDGVTEAGIGAAQTSIYVVMSRVYQAGQLQPWQDLSEELGRLDRNASLVVSRRFEKSTA